MRTINPQTLKSYLPLLPWFILASILGTVWVGEHLLLLGPAETHLERLEAERSAVKQQAIRRQAAKETARDLTRLLKFLPTQRDFAQWPQTIAEEAGHNGVALPSLSYTFEKSDQNLASKILFKGPVTGRYENLRRFIYGLESAGPLMFIDDLDVSRTGKSEREFQNREVITFNLQMSTYVRKGWIPQNIQGGKEATAK